MNLMINVFLVRMLFFLPKNHTNFHNETIKKNCFKIKESVLLLQYKINYLNELQSHKS
jgi:hypothetical protein